MSLQQKQSQFALMVAALINYATKEGYEITLGDAYRAPEVCAFYADQGKGIRDSLHAKRLAIDINLFRDGIYLTDGKAHVGLHDFWDSIGGAERIATDMNHYSLSDGSGVR